MAGVGVEHHVVTPEPELLQPTEGAGDPRALLYPLEPHDPAAEVAQTEGVLEVHPPVPASVRERHRSRRCDPDGGSQPGPRHQSADHPVCSEVLLAISRALWLAAVGSESM